MSSNLRGIIFMVLSTGTFVINDTMLKLAAEGLPPFQTLFLRGVAASLWFLPVVLLTGNGPRMKMALNRWAMLRNVVRAGGGRLLHRGAAPCAARRYHRDEPAGADAAADRLRDRFTASASGRCGWC